MLFGCAALVGSAQGTSDARGAFLDEMNAHITVVAEHIQKMEKLYDGIADADDESVDAIIQEMTQERTSFNKKKCDDVNDAAPRKGIIGFYVYHWYERDDALKKLQSHIDDVKKHAAEMRQLIAQVKNVDADWPVNPETTQELVTKVDQTMQEYIRKIISDFKHSHCNAVGFGYIAQKHGPLFEVSET